MKITRNQTHYIIMTVVYNELNDFTFGNGEVYRDARELISEIAGCPYEECDPFIGQCVSASLKNYGLIKDAFTPNLKKWKWERIPLLTRAILIMSYAHFYFVEKTPKSVIIDIAVSLARKYSDDKQADFIHAILDEVIK